MMETINTMMVSKEVLVEASQETAFDVFTKKMDLWWPRTHHIGTCPMIELILESRAGGRWYSRHEDGSECNIGKVLEWDPWGHVTLAWQIDGNFRFNPDLLTEVVMHFIPEGPKKTRVTLEHRNMEKLLGGEKNIASMDEGWGMILSLYKSVTDAA